MSKLISVLPNSTSESDFKGEISPSNKHSHSLYALYVLLLILMKTFTSHFDGIFKIQ